MHAGEFLQLLHVFKVIIIVNAQVGKIAHKVYGSGEHGELGAVLGDGEAQLIGVVQLGLVAAGEGEVVSGDGSLVNDRSVLGRRGYGFLSLYRSRRSRIGRGGGTGCAGGRGSAV